MKDRKHSNLRKIWASWWKVTIRPVAQEPLENIFHFSPYPSSLKGIKLILICGRDSFIQQSKWKRNTSIVKLSHVQWRLAETCNQGWFIKEQCSYFQWRWMPERQYINFPSDIQHEQYSGDEIISTLPRLLYKNRTQVTRTSELRI